MFPNVSTEVRNRDDIVRVVLVVLNVVLDVSYCGIWSVTLFQKINKNLIYRADFGIVAMALAELAVRGKWDGGAN